MIAIGIAGILIASCKCFQLLNRYPHNDRDAAPPAQNRSNAFIA